MSKNKLNVPDVIISKFKTIDQNDPVGAFHRAVKGEGPGAEFIPADILGLLRRKNLIVVQDDTGRPIMGVNEVIDSPNYQIQIPMEMGNDETITQTIDVPKKLWNAFKAIHPTDAPERVKKLIDKYFGPLQLSLPYNEDEIIKILTVYVDTNKAKTVKSVKEDLVHLDNLLKEKGHLSSALGSKIEAIRLVVQWATDRKPIILEKNDCSRLHNLKAAFIAGKVYDTTNQEYLVMDEVKNLQHTFVMKHNWGEVFKNATIDSNVKHPVQGDFFLPYDMCAFEFRINGKTVIMIVTSPESSGAMFIETNGWWFVVGKDRIEKDGDFIGDKIGQVVCDNIKAMCIALDAEVATHEVIRAPHKLNVKRMKQGKLPLLDYRVVDLAKRYRIANQLRNNEPTRHVRLHFVRAHWRHYENHKTRINWHLRGDPDLGFINKHYLL